MLLIFVKRPSNRILASSKLSTAQTLRKRSQTPDRAPSHVGGSSPHWPAFTPLRWPGFSPPLKSCSFQGTHGIRARGAGRISWTSYARDRGSNCKSKRIQNQRFLCLIGAFADELWLAKQARRLWQLGQPGSTWVVESEQRRPVLSGQRTAAVGLDGGKKRRTIKFVWQPKGNSSLARQVHVIHSPSEANVDTPPLPASCFDRINLHSDWRRACAGPRTCPRYHGRSRFGMRLMSWRQGPGH